MHVYFRKNLTIMRNIVRNVDVVGLSDLVFVGVRRQKCDVMTRFGQSLYNWPHPNPMRVTGHHKVK